MHDESERGILNGQGHQAERDGREQRELHGAKAYLRYVLERYAPHRRHAGTVVCKAKILIMAVVWSLGDPAQPQGERGLVL